MTISHAALVLSLAGAPLTDQAPPRTVPDGIVLQGTLSFDGRATAGNFTGSTTSVKGGLHGGKLSQVRGWVEAPVRTLTTGNQRRDRDLNKSLESAKYPTLRFELTGVAGGESAGDSANLMLHGRFIIHGVTREVAIPASVVFQREGVRVRGQTPLNLKDYKIGGLSKAFGIFKMYPEIVVHVDLTFGATSPERAVDR
jgi:polyisoprenoid-binding protein YceI